MPENKYDVLTFGRSSIDLYSNNIGASFESIKEFGAFVGGSPLNIAVATQRLGLKSALMTAVGEDKVGDFILHFLKKEGVETKFIPRIKAARSSAVVLGIEPPDNFPLVFYRDNCADSRLTIDHVSEVDIANFRLLEMSGTALNQEPARSSAFFLSEKAVKHHVPILLDLDFRADQWHDPMAFGITIRSFLRVCKIAIGTEEEILAATLTDPNQIKINNQQISAPEIHGDINQAILQLMDTGIETLIVKRGQAGCTIVERDGQRTDVPGFQVEVVNVLGAGDAFAGGFIYGFLHGWDHYKTCRMGNACGAILVTKHGCANFNPTLDEVLKFIEEKGGF